MSQPGSSDQPTARRRNPRSAAAKPAAHKPRNATKTPGSVRDPAATRESLLGAARAEFDEHGYEGTDTNRIARRAGYAPQTFYRHFADKTAIFVETYHRWLEDEWKDLAKAHGNGAEEAARILLAHHARHREFRRSLRQLTTSEPAVKAARAESRRRQLGLLDGRDSAQGRVPRGNARLSLLLCVERIADAAADGELSDLGLSPEDEVAMLADAIRRLGRPD